MINMPAKKQKIIGRRKINRENVFLFFRKYLHLLRIELFFTLNKIPVLCIEKLEWV